MRFYSHNRVKVCNPSLCFEQLEERLVFDASVAPDMGALDHHAADFGRDWRLEYSSDPSASAAAVLEVEGLQGYDHSLVLPVNNIGPIPPVIDESNYLDLSGVVSVTCATGSLEVSVTINPFPLTSYGVADLVFRDGPATTNVTWLEPDATNPQRLNKWTFTGPTNGVNAILSTMGVTLASGFHGIAQIEVLSRDIQSGAAATDLDSDIINLNVPYAAGSPTAGDTSVHDLPSTGAFNTMTFFGAGPYTGQTFNAFQSVTADPMHPQYIVMDRDSGILDVAVQVDHGFLTVTPVGSVSLLYSNGIDQPLIQMRGRVQDVDTVLRNMTYEPMSRYNGMDRLTIVAQDNNGSTDRWYADQAGRLEEKSVPFVVRVT